MALGLRGGVRPCLAGGLYLGRGGGAGLDLGPGVGGGARLLDGGGVRPGGGGGGRVLGRGRWHPALPQADGGEVDVEPRLHRLVEEGAERGDLVGGGVGEIDEPVRLGLGPGVPPVAVLGARDRPRHLGGDRVVGADDPVEVDLGVGRGVAVALGGLDLLDADEHLPPARRPRGLERGHRGGRGVRHGGGVEGEEELVDRPAQPPAQRAGEVGGAGLEGELSGLLGDGEERRLVEAGVLLEPGEPGVEERAQPGELGVGAELVDPLAPCLPELRRPTRLGTLNRLRRSTGVIHMGDSPGRR